MVAMATPHLEVLLNNSPKLCAGVAIAIRFDGQVCYSYQRIYLGPTSAPMTAASRIPIEYQVITTRG